MKQSKWTIPSLFLCLLTLAACNTSPAPQSTDVNNVVVEGGMVEAGKGFDAEAFLQTSPSIQPQAVPSTLPSCRSITYPGTSGAIYVQTSTRGTIAWGIYMYANSENAGPWLVKVLVNGRQVDLKRQTYAPHGSVAPVQAKRGGVFQLSSVHTSVSGRTYYSTPNACRIP